MNRILISLALVLSSFNSNGQQSNSFKSSIFYAELAGNAYNQISINYERVFRDNKKIKFGFRGGVGLGGIFEDLDYAKSAIVTNIFGFTGQKKSHIEFGVGLSFLQGAYVVNDVGNSALYLPLNLSYRFQPPTKGVFFRVGLLPIFKIADLKEFYYSPQTRSKFIWTFGLAIGYNSPKKNKT